MTTGWLFAGWLLTAQAVAQDAAEEPKEARADWAAILSLPAQAERLRGKGIEDDDVRSAMDAARDAGLDNEETLELLEASEEGVDQNGPVDNFGAFVQSRLAEGLRGRDLAAAIRAEHVAHGKGKGQRAGKDDRPEKQSERGEGNRPPKGKPDELRPEKGGKGKADQAKGNKAKGQKARGGDQ